MISSNSYWSLCAIVYSPLIVYNGAEIVSSTNFTCEGEASLSQHDWNIRCDGDSDGRCCMEIKDTKLNIIMK